MSMLGKEVYSWGPHSIVWVKNLAKPILSCSSMSTVELDGKTYTGTCYLFIARQLYLPQRAPRRTHVPGMSK